MNESKTANPAVVGLAGFGMTTFILQMHNLGFCGIAPVIWLGLVFGGTAQFLAGQMEFKKGNNFGFCAFTGYGAFWVSLVLMVIFNSNPEITKAYPVLKFEAKDLAFYLAAWGGFTLLLFIGAMKKNTISALIFLTLLLGFIGLSVADFTGIHAAKTAASYILIVCAGLAWYEMALIYLAECGIKLPVGKPWLK